MAFDLRNKYAQQWTIENAQPRFEDALEYAANNEDCLSLQDAKFQSGIPSRTFDYLVNNHDVLRLIKQDIMDHIISRVNRLAIKDQAPASPAIWRMKQLGERDEQHISNTNNSKHEIVVSSNETKEDLDKLFDKLENE